ncbi:ran-binding protein 3 [Amyelois transitella]|uniref:ran-binding protein 3 n=1 Tax=Amyelois transitella TaxID=680683 RepID=UPI0029907AE3|nr:ran-binding protein 3 [Amyelois transitella]
MADAKQGKTPMEDFCNGSSQSRVVLAKPRLGGFGSSSFGSSSSGTSKSCNPFGSVLRPPQLKPGTNPFLKVNEPSEDPEKKTEPENADDRLKETKEETEVPKFVPLGSNVPPRAANPVPVPAQPATSSAGFIFGQNLSERVVINENLNNGEASLTEHHSSNGTSELLFTSAAASVKENAQEEAGPSAAAGRAGLLAAAAEYERSHAPPPPPAATATTTGEEGETNVLQMSCRLFAWESGSWRERGRGVLRLNEARAGGPPRLLARVAGSLRVLLNTRLWPAMVVQRAAAKSLRITAADANNQIKLFLIMVTLIVLYIHIHTYNTRLWPAMVVQRAAAKSLRITAADANNQIKLFLIMVTLIVLYIHIHTYNTRLWPAMVVQRAAAKSLRITAADANNQIKLFLIMGAPVDIAHLHRALTTRIALTKRMSSETSSQKESRLEANDDYPDSSSLPRDDKCLDEACDATATSNATATDDVRATEDTNIQADPQKTDSEPSDSPENESKALKRKEPPHDESSPKRQCPDIVIE